MELPFLVKACDLFVYLNLHFRSSQFKEVTSTFVTNIHQWESAEEEARIQQTITAYKKKKENTETMEFNMLPRSIRMVNWGWESDQGKKD